MCVRVLGLARQHRLTGRPLGLVQRVAPPWTLLSSASASASGEGFLIPDQFQAVVATCPACRRSTSLLPPPWLHATHIRSRTVLLFVVSLVVLASLRSFSLIVGTYRAVMYVFCHTTLV